MIWIAHRSGPTVYPEQTIASAREALSQGADMVEIDVRLSADGEVIVSHDKNLRRIFGVDRDTGEITAEQFLALRHSADVSYPAHLLQDYLRCNILPLLIHVKEHAALPRTMELLHAYRCAERTTLGVESAESALWVRRFDAVQKILAFMPDVSLIEEFVRAGAHCVRLWESWLSPEHIDQVRALGAELWIMSGGAEPGHGVGEPSVEGLCRILDAAPDAILVNNVPLARAVHAEM